MIAANKTPKLFWWLVHKDFNRAIRQCAWPAMLLLGVVLVGLVAVQIDLPDEQKDSLIGGLLWLPVVFAGTIAIEWSIVSEHEDGCLQVLRLYPIATSTLYFAKVTVNVASMMLVELVLVPLFIVMADVPLLSKPAALALIATLGNIGFAAAGTLISAITAGLRNRGGLLALLFLPLVMPVILACARATSMMLTGEIDAEWWRWIQFLAVCAIVFTGVGAIMFGAVLEE